MEFEVGGVVWCAPIQGLDADLESKSQSQTCPTLSTPKFVFRVTILPALSVSLAKGVGEAAAKRSPECARAPERDTGEEERGERGKVQKSQARVG